MRGARVLITQEPRGKKFEGIVAGTPYPGTILEVNATAVDSMGRHTWGLYNPGGDGQRPIGPYAVLLERGEGYNWETIYVSGDQCFLYIPLPGDEMNLLWSEAGTGTGDAVAVADKAIVDDGTGLLIDTTGSVESEPFIAMEAVTDVVATGTMVWVMATGH